MSDARSVAVGTAAGQMAGPIIIVGAGAIGVYLILQKLGIIDHIPEVIEIIDDAKDAGEHIVDSVRTLADDIRSGEIVQNVALILGLGERAGTYPGLAEWVHKYAAWSEEVEAGRVWVILDEFGNLVDKLTGEIITRADALLPDPWGAYNAAQEELYAATLEGLRASAGSLGVDISGMGDDLERIRRAISDRMEAMARQAQIAIDREKNIAETAAYQRSVEAYWAAFHEARRAAEAAASIAEQAARIEADHAAAMAQALADEAAETLAATQAHLREAYDGIMDALGWVPEDWYETLTGGTT